MGLQEVQLEDDEFDAIERCLQSAEQSSTCGSKRKLPLSPLPAPITAAPRLLCTASAVTGTPASEQCSGAAPEPAVPQPVAASTFISTVRRVPASLQRPQPQLWGGSSSKQPGPCSAPSAAAQAPTSDQLAAARQASGPASTSGRSDAAPDLGLRQLQFNGRIVYASTAAEVDAACLQLLHRQGPRVVGLDIEWCARYIRGQAPDPTALLQICYCRGADGEGDVRPGQGGRGCVCLLLHLKHSGMTAHLKELLLRQDILKVGVGIRGDAIKLHGDFGFAPEALLELSDEANRRVLAAVPQVTASTETRRWSLADLTAEVLKASMNKSQGLRVSDWDKKPLPLHQQQYAACDAFASLALHWALQACPLRKQQTSS